MRSTESGTNATVILLLEDVLVAHPVENLQNIIVESTEPEDNKYFIGETEVTFTAIDSSGHTVTCTVAVSVIGEIVNE